MYFYAIFFFKQKTAYDMRISDWSSDVCSSDLQQRRATQIGCIERLGIAGDLARDAAHLIDDVERLVRGVLGHLHDVTQAMTRIRHRITGDAGETVIKTQIDHRRVQTPRQFGNLTVERLQIGRASCRERVCQYV